MLSYHNGSITKALVDLFSLSANISLSNCMFIHSYFLLLNCLKLNFISAMWSQENNRRLFFEKFAEENNFDPLIASNWYTQRRVDIVSRKVYFLFYLIFFFCLSKLIVKLISIFHREQKVCYHIMEAVFLDH